MLGKLLLKRKHDFTDNATLDGGVLRRTLNQGGVLVQRFSNSLGKQSKGEYSKLYNSLHFRLNMTQAIP